MRSHTESAVDQPFPASVPLHATAEPKATGLIAALGGLVGALAASSCCIAPFVFFSLGISGAWIAHLTALEPYQPVFIVITLGFLGAGYYRTLHNDRVCADGSCARPLPRRIVTSALWLATALVLAAIAFPYVAPPLLGV